MADQDQAAPAHLNPFIVLPQEVQVNVLANVSEVDDLCSMFKTCMTAQQFILDPIVSIAWLLKRTEAEMAALWVRIMVRNSPTKRDDQFDLLTSAAIMPLHLAPTRLGRALLEAMRLECTWFIDRLSDLVPLTMTVADAATLSERLFRANANVPAMRPAFLIRIQVIGEPDWEQLVVAPRVLDHVGPRGVMLVLDDDFVLDDFDAALPPITLMLGTPAAAEDDDVAIGLSPYRFVLGAFSLPNGVYHLGVNPHEAWDQLMHDSIRYGPSVESLIVRLLRDHPDVNMNLVVDGSYPLNQACENGMPDVVLALLDRPGVNIFVPTPLNALDLLALLSNPQMEAAFVRLEAMYPARRTQAFQMAVFAARAPGSNLHFVRVMMARHKDLQGEILAADAYLHPELFELLLTPPLTGASPAVLGFVLRQVCANECTHESVRAVRALMNCRPLMTIPFTHIDATRAMLLQQGPVENPLRQEILAMLDQYEAIPE